MVAVPQLRVARTAPNAVLLAWPTNTVTFVLQENSNPTPMNWVDVTNAIGLIGGECQVTVSPAPGQKFYRLKYP